MSSLPTLDRIYVGDAVSVMRRWPDSFVDLVLTSPPYFNLRDYGVGGQIGLEKAPEEYIARMMQVVRECGRILKPTGSLYLNIGDTYRGKTLLGIPWRVALAMTAEGWLLRNEIVWAKPHGLPTPIKDRLNTTHEKIFHFVKQPTYYFDLDAIRVPTKGTYREGSKTRRFAKGARLPHRPGVPVAGNFRPHPLGKNPGDVWTIGPETRPKKYIAPGETAHFAPYPEALCERPILAASPPDGIVFDPFVGSGTTALVARRLGRHFLGTELSPEYARLARRRLALNKPPHVPSCSHRSFPPRSSRGTPIKRLCSYEGARGGLSFSTEQERER